MKAFLTGLPHVGKSTALRETVGRVHARQGFYTQEILDEETRIGFEVVASTGQSAMVASVYSESDTRVSKYGVDIDGLDTVIEGLIPIESGRLLYVDEVGQMQLNSERFQKLVIKYLNSDNHFIGTLTSVFENEFTHLVRKMPGVEVIEITPGNRDDIPEQLVAML